MNSAISLKLLICTNFFKHILKWLFYLFQKNLSSWINRSLALQACLIDSQYWQFFQFFSTFVPTHVYFQFKPSSKNCTFGIWARVGEDLLFRNPVSYLSSLTEMWFCWEILERNRMQQHSKILECDSFSSGLNWSLVLRFFILFKLFYLYFEVPLQFKIHWRDLFWWHLINSVGIIMLEHIWDKHKEDLYFKYCWEDEAIILCSCLVDPSPEMNIKGNYLGLAWLQLNWFLCLTTSFARNFTRKLIKRGFLLTKRFSCVANDIYRFPICWANADIRSPFPKVNGVVLDIFLYVQLKLKKKLYTYLVKVTLSRSKVLILSPIVIRLL